MSSILDTIFVREKHVCPWYCCFTFDNVLRKLVHDPARILSGLVAPGHRVMDIGPGQGYFTIPMARMVGAGGQVACIDIQAKMLSLLKSRAEKAGVGDRVVCKLVTDTEFGLDSEMDFALTFWMVHEVPDKQKLIQSIYKALKPNGRLLIAEPLLHVTKKSLEDVRGIAEAAGFRLVDRPRIFFSRAIVLQKG